MTDGRTPSDLGTTIAGVRFPFCAMNASGAWSSTAVELRDLARSASGAIVLKTATVHPFVHPSYRSLHNPGYDRYLPLVRELAAMAERPVIASVGGTTADEFATLAHAFAEAGAALVEANLADPYVAGSLAAGEDREVLRAVLARMTSASAVPVSVKLPERLAYPYPVLCDELAAAGVRVVVTRNDFAGLEKLRIAGGGVLELIAVGGVQSGYDVERALAKGAKAVQVGSALMTDGPGIFARLAREMHLLRRERVE
jgi:dihydroorotate dehydrogenase (fumarate)